MTLEYFHPRWYLKRKSPSTQYYFTPAAVSTKKPKSRCNVPHRSWKNCLWDTYALLTSATGTAFLIQVSHTTVLRWLRDTERTEITRPAPKSDILRDRLQSVVQNDPLITLGKAQNDDRSHHGRFCFLAAGSSGPETTGIQSEKESLFTHGHLPSKSQLQESSRNSAIRIQHRDVGLFSRSMRLASGETVKADMSNPGAGTKMYVESNSKRPTTSSVLEAAE
jgi:hypothetical protein